MTVLLPLSDCVTTSSGCSFKNLLVYHIFKDSIGQNISTTSNSDLVVTEIVVILSTSARVDFMGISFPIKGSILNLGPNAKKLLIS